MLTYDDPMPYDALLLYLLKANAVVSVLFLAYLLLLRNLTFFGLNRVFLLVALLLSVLLPLAPPITLPGTDRLPAALVGMYPGVPFYGGLYDQAHGVDPDDTTLPSGNAAPAEALPVGQFLAVMYVAVAGLLLVRFGRQLYRVLGLIRASRRRVGEGVTYCEHDGPLSPFSFFGCLVLNPAGYSDEQLQQIVAHEKVHIRQGHTADILLAEGVQILLWANPLVYGLKKHLKLNLEYIVDRQVLDAGADKQHYQWAILRSTAGPAAYAVTNPFHASKLKLRIRMMNTRHSAGRHLYKYAFVLPLVALTYLLVNGYQGMPARAQAGNNTRSFSASLRPFEGYYKYQLTPARMEYIRLTVAEDDLVLKELWNGRKVKINRQTELKFVDETGAFPLVFTKGAGGAITGVLINNRDLWKRADDFKPQEPLTVRLSPGQLRPFEGKYQQEHNQEAVLQAVARENSLVLTELWSGREIRYVPTSENEFRHEDGEVSMPLKFIRAHNGSATQLVAYGRDVFNRNDSYTPRTRRQVQLPLAQLKAFEGRYGMVDRPGDFLQVTAKENGLVVKASWSASENSVVPENELAFFSKKNPFSLQFTKDARGNVTQLLVSDHDLWTKVQE
ncbi:MAG: M56 family metallopeptidase [Cytophagales bacterium]|nr:M56 family metallopeptidase [Cytophagales bacterium]